MWDEDEHLLPEDYEGSFDDDYDQEEEFRRMEGWGFGYDDGSEW